MCTCAFIHSFLHEPRIKINSTFQFRDDEGAGVRGARVVGRLQEEGAEGDGKVEGTQAVLKTIGKTKKRKN